MVGRGHSQGRYKDWQIWFKFVLVFFFLGASVSAEAVVLDLNDVSYLLPLPRDPHAAALLSPGTEAEAGPLIPQAYLDLLPKLLPRLDPQTAIDELKVVGIRLDPCFSSPCRAQIRMVWQPLSLDSSGNVLAADAAVHSFYELKGSEFCDLMNQVAQLKTSFGVSSSRLPLGIHPALLDQGFSGPFWRAFRKLILSYSGAGRLSRVTFMNTVVDREMWDFGGFEPESRGSGSGKIDRIPIPRIEARIQSFINSSDPLNGFLGGAKPAPSGSDTFNEILDGSSEIDSALLRKSSDAVFRVENPQIHSASTVDCVSCHTAGPVRLWMETKFPDLGLDASAFRFTAPENLSNSSPLQKMSTLLRAFGYEGKVPAFNDRTINESAAVLERLQAMPQCFADQ
jgi:hypothetical protein